MITVFITVRQLIVLDVLLEGQKYNQEYFVQNILPSLLHEKKCFSRKKTGINFFVRMNNSMRHNWYRIVDELRRMKILRASHSPYSPDISPYDFWMFRDFKEKLKDRYLQGPKKIIQSFQELRYNIIFEELQMTFESWHDRLHWIIEHEGEYFRK
jgi:histone-lysine N-methyltransferase SETMAR